MPTSTTTKLGYIPYRVKVREFILQEYMKYTYGDFNGDRGIDVSKSSEGQTYKRENEQQYLARL